MDLSGLDFFGDVLAGTGGRLLPLNNSLWHSARLIQTEFQNVDLSGADPAEIAGRMSRWLGCRLQGARFGGADLQGSIGRDLDLANGLLDNSNLRDATAVKCRVNGTPWRPAPEIDACASWAVSKQGGGVLAVALGRAGDREVVVAGGDDGSVQLWDAVSGAELAVLARQGGWVLAVALGRAGDREVVVAGGDDGSVRLWDAVSGAELAVLAGQGGGVRAVALGRAGDREVVVFLLLDRAVRIVDLDTATFQPGRTLILGPGRHTLLDLLPDNGGYHLNRFSDDAWRYWRAQGFVDGRLVNFPIDDMAHAA